MHPPLHPLHQTQRDQTPSRLGGEPGQTSGRIPGPSREHQSPPSWIRLPQSLQQVPAKVRGQTLELCSDAQQLENDTNNEFHNVSSVFAVLTPDFSHRFSSQVWTDGATFLGQLWHRGRAVVFKSWYQWYESQAHAEVSMAKTLPAPNG